MKNPTFFKVVHAEYRMKFLVKITDYETLSQFEEVSNAFILCVRPPASKLIGISRSGDVVSQGDVMQEYEPGKPNEYDCSPENKWMVRSVCKTWAEGHVSILALCREEIERLGDLKHKL